MIGMCLFEDLEGVVGHTLPLFAEGLAGLSRCRQWRIRAVTLFLRRVSVQTQRMNRVIESDRTVYAQRPDKSKSPKRQTGTT